MASWRLAKGLIKLREQINAKYPMRSKLSDGSIADARHVAAGTSDHIPNAQGVVTAIDITKDETNGPNTLAITQALTQDSRVKYLIYNRRIWKARTGIWEPYHGENAHDHHWHLSIKTDLCDDEHTWTLDTNIPPESYPVLKLGAAGLAVRVLQEKLNMETTGTFDATTDAKVRLFQRAHGLKDDGIVGPKTWTALLAG